MLTPFSHRPQRTGARRRALIVLLLAGIMTVTGLVSPATAAEKTYIFGVNPWDKPDVMRKMFRPLMDYLKEQTGIPFRISISSTYEQLVTDLATGYVQLGSVNAVSYLKAKQKFPNLQFLAMATKKTGDKLTASYEGFIIVRKDSPYQSLEDLRGKRFAFVEQESNSGYKMPLALMAQKGLDPKTFFRKYFFVGDHDEVAKAVKNHSVEGGATWDNSYDMNTKRYGPIFRIILRTPPIPNEAWIAGPGVPKDVALKIKQCLLSINENTRTADGRLVIDANAGFPNNGWGEPDEAIYDTAAPLLLYQDKDK